VRELVETIAKALVDRPDEVRVDERVGATTAITLQVAPGDLGRVIGRQGRAVKALRTLVAAKARAEGRRVNLEILD
jgi:predicted RNA-binding protein YlqC (UPF0109 family)